MLAESTNDDTAVLPGVFLFGGKGSSNLPGEMFGPPIKYTQFCLVNCRSQKHVVNYLLRKYEQSSTNDTDSNE